MCCSPKRPLDGVDEATGSWTIAPPLDEPNVSHLHRACLLWTYYLRAESEVKNQAYLYEAARHLMLHQPCGNEGEGVYVQVWEAIRRRKLARAYIKTDFGFNYAQATDEGGIATFRIISTSQ